MDAHVLHIGVDECHRVEVLRSVGYRVDECASLLQLARALERSKGADAMFLTETRGISPEHAVMVARERWTAPVILFRSSNRDTTEAAFDLVIEPLTSPQRWLREVAILVEWSRGLRSRAQISLEQARPARRARILPWEWERPRESRVSRPARAWNSPPGSH